MPGNPGKESTKTGGTKFYSIYKTQKHMAISKTKRSVRVHGPGIRPTPPESIIAYKEKPAPNRYTHYIEKDLSAETLFSQFTAEVIKKNTVFTR
jgi:hypothetical protein